MRALLVGNFLSASGANRGYSEELADRGERRGWRVIRTSTRQRPAARLLDMLRTTWSTRPDYDVAHIDVFSGPSFLWAEAVTLLLRRLGKPFVLTLRGGNLPAFATRFPRRMRRLLGDATRVAAPSRYLQSQLEPYRSDIIVLPNALDTAALPFVPRLHPGPRLVWIRAFHEIYNPVLAVEVLAIVAASYPDVTLTMVGPDKDGSRAKVEERADQLGVTDRLTLIDRIPKAEVAHHLSLADLFLNTSNIDNAPVTMLEAMAAGLCVVSTDVGGIPFLVDRERHAILVPARDPDRMAAAIMQLLATPALAARLSHAGHDLACACDWEPILDRWEQLLGETAALA